MFVLPNQLSLFSGIEDPDLVKQIDELKILRFPKGFLLFEQGDQENDVLGILHGEVEIVGRSKTGDYQRIALLKEGDLLGEFSYFTGQPRSFAAVTMGDSALLSIRAKWLQSMGEKYPSLKQRLGSVYRSRVLGNVLRSSKLFSRIPSKRLEAFSSKMKFQVYQDRDPIIQEGENDLDIYVIKSGKVVVSKMKQGTPMVLKELGPGELFGEMAIVTGQPRSASAVASGRVELMVLKGEEFKTFLKFHPLLLHAVEDMVRNRSAQMRQALENVVSEVLEEVWDEESLTTGLRVHDLKVQVEIKRENGQLQGEIEEVSAQRWMVLLEGTASQPKEGEKVVLQFGEGKSKFSQELKKVPPLSASIGAFEGGKLELRIGRDVINTKGIHTILGILARAKLKGLIFPRYEAKGVGITVRIHGKKGAKMRGELLSLSVTNARLSLEGALPIGEMVLLVFEKNGESLAEVHGISLEMDQNDLEIQFEYGTSEERSGLEKIIRLLSGKVALAPTSARVKSEKSIQRATVLLERSFKTSAEFVRTYMTSIEAGRLKVPSPKAVAAGTPVQVRLLIPGFPEVRRATCIGIARAWAKGKSVIEFTDEQPELKERLAALFAKLMSLQSEKSWQERKNNLQMGRNYSVWEDPTPRTVILIALILANLALYFFLYF